MIEREKVIKGLEYHLKELTVGKTCYECPYCGDNPCEIQLIANAIALLKEQEPRVLTLEQEPIKVERRMEETEWNVCGNCGSHVIHKWAYCPYCGKRLKWDE